MVTKHIKNKVKLIRGRILTLSIIAHLIISATVCAQSNSNDTIWWASQNYSLISEMENVILKPKFYKNVSNIKLIAIDSKNNRITYEINKAYHDLTFDQIDYIAPSKNFTHYISFENGKAPTIINQSSEQNNSREAKSFKVYAKPQTSITANTISGDNSKTNSTFQDQLIYPGGKIQYINVIQITSEHITYLRRELPDGPKYTISLLNLRYKIINNNYIVHINN